MYIPQTCLTNAFALFDLYLLAHIFHNNQKDNI
jgi:hypothetical protein